MLFSIIERIGSQEKGRASAPVEQKESPSWGETMAGDQGEGVPGEVCTPPGLNLPNRR